MNIILLGPPGSGKGTQSKKIIEKYGLFHISTGELFRYHIAHKTLLGQQVKEIVNNGSLVPDDITLSILETEIQKNKDTATGFLFDGFPRTLNQARSLDNLLGQYESAIDFAIVLKIYEKELKDRIAHRKKIENRADDDDEKLDKRIKSFFDETIHTFPLYKNQGVLVTIDGTGEIDEIAEKIEAIIGKNTL